MTKRMEELIEGIKSNWDFAKRARCLYDYYFNGRVRGKDMAVVYELDEIDGKKKPFFNGFCTLEDVGLHLRIKMDGDNFYGNIYDSLVEILEKNGSDQPEMDSAEIMMLFFKACALCTKKNKKPFYISVQKINDRRNKTNEIGGNVVGYATKGGKNESVS